MIVAQLVFDVTGRVAIDGPLQIAAAVYLPEPHLLMRPARAFVALPGGGYSKGYFNIAIAGHPGYSQAEHHVERGIIFIAIDPLGVGKSSSSRFDRLSIDSIAAANDYAVRGIVQMLHAWSSLILSESR